MNNLELEKKVKALVHSLKYEKGYVCSVDVLLALEYLSKEDYGNWRFGKVEYLEKVCGVNLNKLTLINSLIRKESNELNLKESITVYTQYGNGPKRKLRFSKTGTQSIEKAYLTHFLDIERIKEKKNGASVQRV